MQDRWFDGICRYSMVNTKLLTLVMHFKIYSPNMFTWVTSIFCISLLRNTMDLFILKIWLRYGLFSGKSIWQPFISMKISDSITSSKNTFGKENLIIYSELSFLTIDSVVQCGRFMNKQRRSFCKLFTLSLWDGWCTQIWYFGTEFPRSSPGHWMPLLTRQSGWIFDELGCLGLVVLLT